MSSVIVAWASGNKEPQDRTGLITWEDNVSSCPGACQTRMVTIYGCQNANQEECYKYTDWEKWKKRHLRLAGRFWFLLRC